MDLVGVVTEWEGKNQFRMGVERGGIVLRGWR